MENEIIRGNSQKLRKTIGICAIISVVLFVLCMIIIENGRNKYDYLFIVNLMLIFPIVICSILYISMAKTEIIVTNKRVYGVGAFKKRIDLPLDLISVVGTSLLKGITIGTSSGKISFMGISNNENIHLEISKLLNNRQERNQVKNQNTTEELKQYKELLDNGIITQEEFNTKKKQLLNL